MQKMRERNEALDTRIYARAAASHFGIDRFQEQHWAALEHQMGSRAAAALTARAGDYSGSGTGQTGTQPGAADPFNRDDKLLRRQTHLVSPIGRAGSTGDSRRIGSSSGLYMVHRSEEFRSVIRLFSAHYGEHIMGP